MSSRNFDSEISKGNKLSEIFKIKNRKSLSTHLPFLVTRTSQGLCEYSTKTCSEVLTIGES